MNNDLEVTRQSRPAVNLDVVAGRCSNGECPTIYKTDRGTYVVQGYTFEPADGGVLPDGERMVEIPAAIVAELVSMFD